MHQESAAIPLLARFSAFAAEIKLSHSVFALPFALLGLFLGARHVRAGLPSIIDVVLIVACMVLARTFAMGMNRLLDARLDALNPRTARRAIPAGKLSIRFVAMTVGICASLFVLTTVGFGVADGNWLPLLLSAPALAFIGAYPLLKRFSAICHYYLGAALGLAPVCAWIAVTGRIDVVPIVIGLAVLCWTAGFDILYACQDVDSDRTTGTFSVPAKIGIARSLWVARFTHVLSVALLTVAGLVSAELHAVWFTGVAIAVVLLVYEHSLVKPNDLSKLNLAFFTLNGVISLCLGTLGIIDTLF